MKHTSTFRGKPLGIQERALLCVASREALPLASTMRKILFIVLCFCLAGCSTIVIPNYIKDQNPYKQKFYADYGTAVAASEKALLELGWEIEDRLDPIVYEQNRRSVEGEGHHILIISKVRQRFLTLGSRYARVNVYIVSGESETEIEIRYLTLNSVGFKKIKNYREDRAVKNIFERVEYYLD